LFNQQRRHEEHEVFTLLFLRVVVFPLSMLNTGFVVLCLKLMPMGQLFSVRLLSLLGNQKTQPTWRINKESDYFGRK